MPGGFSYTPRGYIFFIPLFYFPGGVFFITAPFFSALGARFPQARVFFRMPPRPFSARDTRAADTPGGYIFRPSGDFPGHAKNPGGRFPGDHGAGALFLRRVRRVADKGTQDPFSARIPGKECRGVTAHVTRAADSLHRIKRMKIPGKNPGTAMNAIRALPCVQPCGPRQRLSSFRRPPLFARH